MYGKVDLDRREDTMISLANEIKAYRKRYDLTQSDVASKMGVSLTTYVNYENNPFSMSIGFLIKLCEVLDKNLVTAFFTTELYKMYNKEK